MDSASEQLDDLLQRWEESVETGQEVSPTELCKDTPHLQPELEKRIAKLQALRWMGVFEAPASHQYGRTLAGYRLLAKLGRGGFGVVWKAQDPHDGLIALKVIDCSEGEVVSELRVFEQLRTLRHPNVLTIFDVQRDGDAIVIAMELAEGSLLDRLHQLQEKGWPGIPRDELLRGMADAAAGIDALHANGLTHRDIKPSNLLIVGGVVKIADFGLAKVLAGSKTGHTGGLTLNFAAPEYFEGRTTREGDQYGLAVSYCQLFAGRLPFEGTPAQVMAGHLRDRPDLSMVPESQRDAVSRALAKRPGGRWPSCAAFVESLTGQGPGAAPKDETLALPVRMRSWRWALAAPLAFLIFLGVLLVLWTWDRAKDADAKTPSLGGVPQIPGPDKESDAKAPPRAEKPSKMEAPALDSLPSFEFVGNSKILTPVERFAPVTLECWALPQLTLQGRPEKYLVGSDIPGHSGIGIAFMFRERRSLPELGVQLLPVTTVRGIDTARPIPLARWSHIAAVFGKTETVVYHNGLEVGRGAPTANLGGTVFVVGSAGRDNPDHFFVGRIRNVRFSRGERYTANFHPKTEFEPDPSALLIYSASHTEGGRAIDRSGNGHHGTMKGVKVAEGIARQ